MHMYVYTYVCIYVWMNVFLYLFDRGIELVEHKHYNLIPATHSTIPSVTGLKIEMWDLGINTCKRKWEEAGLAKRSQTVMWCKYMLGAMEKLLPV